MSWNQQTGKALNKQNILHTIFTKNSLSRNELIEMTGLKKATIANLVAELLQESYLIEDGKIQSTGGRRSHILRINNQAGYALGLDVGVNYLRGEIVDFTGNKIYEKVKPIMAVDFKLYEREIFGMIDLLIKQVPSCRYNILGLGVAIPGLIDPDGVILNAPNLKWSEVDLYSKLTKKYSFPIHLVNEADAGAYAEYKLQPSQSTHNLIYVSVGIGIGVGLIINGQFYKGSFGVSGESGHNVINMFGRQCACGQVGCWEAYASESALLNEARSLLPSKPVSLEYLIELANQGQPNVLALFNDYGKYIGVGLTNLIHTINPDKVVIGNRITKAKKYIEHSLLQTLQHNTMSYHLEHCEISFSINEERSSVLGAAALAIFNFIEKDVH